MKDIDMKAISTVHVGLLIKYNLHTRLFIGVIFSLYALCIKAASAETELQSISSMGKRPTDHLSKIASYESVSLKFLI